MADTMLQHYKAWVNLCVYTQTRQYIPITSAIPQNGLWPPLPLVLALVPLQKFPIAFKIFQWKCPLQNENSIALSKRKLQACN